MEHAGQHLLEREDDLARLDALLSAVVDDHRGRLAVIAGDAGIGKTTLVRAFAERHPRARVLWGACDALATPRPLGPLVEVAAALGGDVLDAVDAGQAPAAVADALLRALRTRRGTVVVLEDLHWADQATLDVLRVAGRRVAAAGALLIVTHRDDEGELVREALAELPPADLHRLRPCPLTAAAVAALATPAGLDADELLRRTGGNPFFVTEVLAAGGGIPESVRDAVLARCGRLPHPARQLLDAVAIMPTEAELDLLEAIAGPELAGLDACLEAGVLRDGRHAVAFRHEIARAAVEEALRPHRRRELHRAALAAASAAAGLRRDVSRLAHHAAAAGDAAAVLRHAPQAGERAARLGAHREAAAHYGRALRFADELPAVDRITLLERRAYECYLVDATDDAIAARREALREHQALGDAVREGDTRRWLSRMAWFAGDTATADAEAAQAVAILEPLGDGPELAMALSNMAQLRMLDGELEEVRAWGRRAIAMAEAVGATEVLVHALNNVGAAELLHEQDAGREKLERSLALAREGDLEEHVARAHCNLLATAVVGRDHATSEDHALRGLAFCRERDLEAWWRSMTGDWARSLLDQGRWDEAADAATAALDAGHVALVSRVIPTLVLGRLRARRGDPQAWEALDQAAAMARESGELQFLVPTACARAEAHWLAGRPERVGDETEEALALALSRRHRWRIGELVQWRRRAGLPDGVAAELLPEPVALEVAGDPRAAARSWTAIGCPYEAALARVEDPDDDAARAGVAALRELGAHPAADVVSRALRERGIRDLPGRPRAQTRENPVGLTARELEVLALVAEGLRNADIAERLSLSERTVAHHVSAVLRKFGAGSRGAAAAEAARLGILVA